MITSAIKLYLVCCKDNAVRASVMVTNVDQWPLDKKRFQVRPGVAWPWIGKTQMGCNVSSPKRKHHVERNGDMLRRVRGGSRLGNGNCEAARSEAGMSYESWIVRTRESKKDKYHGAGASSRGSAPRHRHDGSLPQKISRQDAGPCGRHAPTAQVEPRHHSHKGISADQALGHQDSSWWNGDNTVNVSFYRL